MDDLSASELSPQELAQADLGLREHAHRVNLQRSAFSTANVVAVLLLMMALVLAGVVMYLYATKDKFDWHVVLLVGAFLLPASVIMIAILRAAFPKAGTEEAALPLTQAIKDLKDIVGNLRDDKPS